MQNILPKIKKFLLDLFEYFLQFKMKCNFELFLICPLLLWFCQTHFLLQGMESLACRRVSCGSSHEVLFKGDSSLRPDRWLTAPLPPTTRLTLHFRVLYTYDDSSLNCYFVVQLNSRIFTSNLIGWAEMFLPSIIRYSINC